jgi:NOL1/NOP2/sun family putative RNA methylase
MRKTFFPEPFIKRYKEMLGAEWESFFETIKRKQPKGFWVNTNKASVEEVKESLGKKNILFEQLQMHPQAFSINYNEPGKLDEYKNGWISVQEKASMMPVIALSPHEGDKVLDACAAPGMKTIQLSNMAAPNGKVLATDVHDKRLAVLNKVKKNFELDNVETKRIDFRNVKRNKKFDKVLLDAPCSSEGLVRKQREALVNWSEKLVRQKAAVQKNLIVKAFDYLREGGEMVYSTCSFAPEENEEVVTHLLKQRSGAKVVNVEELLKGVKIRKNDLCENCVRLFPQDNDTQQFFLAKIRKD